MSKKYKIIFWLAIIICVFWFSAWVLARTIPIREPKIYGATFSSFFAEQFGLNWQSAYIALLDDLGVRHLRVPAYWEEIEPERGVFNFDRIDWQLAEAKKRSAYVILAVGRKLPRWPECHEPSWAPSLSEYDFKNALLLYEKNVLERYRNDNTIVIWQIENEPFLSFGCTVSKSILDAELAQARSMGVRPIMVSDSGEIGEWVRSASRSDVFGSSMYRTVAPRFLGGAFTFTYPLPPSFFRLKRAITQQFTGPKPMIIVELQAEPWSKKALPQMTVEEQYKTMNPERFHDMLQYASQSGFDTFYFWGVEWWYWLKTTQDKPEMWNIAKEVIQSVK